jgi:hypothetical protein
MIEMEEKDKQIYLQRLKLMEEIKTYRKFKFNFNYFVKIVICCASLVFYHYLTSLCEQPHINTFTTPSTKVDDLAWYKNIEPIYLGKNSVTLKLGNVYMHETKNTFCANL